MVPEIEDKAYHFEVPGSDEMRVPSFQGYDGGSLEEHARDPSVHEQAEKGRGFSLHLDPTSDVEFDGI